MAQGTTKGVPIDIDPTLAADSDLLVPSQKAIKTYVDTNFLNPSDLSATTPLTYSSSTGVFTINQASSLSNGYLTSTDWSTFNGKGSGTVTSVAALTLGTSGTDLGSSVATGTTTPVITLNVPTASATNRGALSSTDWSTFNGKQNAITLTTIGTSGAATLVGSTLNVPQYAGTGSGVSVLSSVMAQNVAASSTRYHSISGTISTLTTPYQVPMPLACTLNTFYVRSYTSAQPASGSLVVTLQKNAVDTALTITIAAGSAAGTFTDLSNSVTFAAGDTWQIKLVNNATATSTPIAGYTFKMTI